MQAHIFLDRCAHGFGITNGKGKNHKGPLALKAPRQKGPLALKATRPRDNTSERVVFIKTMQFINPDIDYQDAAAAYDDYFTPLIARAAKEWPAAPRRHGPAPRCSSPDPRSPYRRLAIRSREPRPGSSYRGARRNRIIREEKGVWSHKCATCPAWRNNRAGLFLLCAHRT